MEKSKVYFCKEINSKNLIKIYETHRHDVKKEGRHHCAALRLRTVIEST